MPEPAQVTAMFSGPWCLTLLQQMAIGIALGFVLQVVFETVMVGGELIAYSMGLGFAQLADPLRGAPSPVVGQFMLVMTSLLFLAAGGHLVLMETLAGSFRTLPVGPSGIGADQWHSLAQLGAQMFAGGVTLALPVMIALLVINFAMGVISRSAPSLNLMAVGFPAALIAGLLIWGLSLGGLQERVEQLLLEANRTLGALAAGAIGG
jgi:flagellar biosynthetic protein FliR